MNCAVNSLVSAEVDRSDVAVCDEMRQLFLGVAEMVDEMLAGTFCLFFILFRRFFLPSSFTSIAL